MTIQREGETAVSNDNVDLRYQARSSQGLRYGIIEVTTLCQMRCPGCYMVRRNALNKGAMSLQTATWILDLCKEYRDGKDLETMDILGGEPLLWPYLKDYIEALLARGILPWIFTNMVAITPEMAKWLFERQIHITGKLNIADPEDPFQFALQAGMLGQTPQMARKLFDAIEVFREAGYRDPLFRLQNLIRKRNLALVPGYIRYCRSKGLGVDLELMGSGETVGPDYFKIAPTPQELAALIMKLKEENLDGFSDISRVLMPHLFGSCPFYDKGLYFAVDGTIRACSNSTVTLAHVSDPDPVRKAYESTLICDRLKLTQELVGEPCHSCDRWDRCRGGCRATVEGSGDSFGGYTLCPLPYLNE